MLRRVTCLLLTLSLTLLVLGCQSGSGPFQKRAANDTPLANSLYDTYTVVLKQLTTAKRLGFITDEEKGVIEPYRSAAREAIDHVAVAEMNDNIVDAGNWRQKFDEALDWMLQWAAKANVRKKAAAATRSVTMETPCLPKFSPYSPYSRDRLRWPISYRVC